jgi:predicted deacetylase
MTARMAVLADRLDRSDAPLKWFFRDDDAGWAEPELLRLLNAFSQSRTHLDIAAIPLELSREAANRIRPFLDDGVVAVHQHGLMHVNHQHVGRRAEFGTDRTETEQRNDLLRGANVLAERFDGRVEPFFTPPWNRCSDDTPALLAECGFTALSRDRSALRHDPDDLIEIPVTVDWDRCWRTGGQDALERSLCDAVKACDEDGEPFIGIMLHHAQMTDLQLGALTGLLDQLDRNRSVEVTSMGALVGGQESARSVEAACR